MLTLLILAAKVQLLGNNCVLAVNNGKHKNRYTINRVSEHNNSIVAATDLLKSLQQVVPTTAEEKQKYITAIRKLTAMIENHPTQETQGAPRVDETPTTTLIPRQPGNFPNTRQQTKEIKKKSRHRGGPTQN